MSTVAESITQTAQSEVDQFTKGLIKRNPGEPEFHSGSGNVAMYAAEKVIQRAARS